MIRHSVAFCIGSLLVMTVFILLSINRCSTPTVGPTSAHTVLGCRAACTRLAELHCIEGVLNCAAWCAEYEDMGLDQHTGCLSRIASCAEAPRCALEGRP
jgi:hypothetical protein